ncbi:hypothetical protein QA640_06325 [Bradyrhizobium sp. CB82]|uniref:hypothetical protein n=1 Tax=Bradyrhizobium sp. CB82 TaxID=3039159 RepID=UPI0024B0BD6A|nr:hypothetical protein [Bradyrhizobium sp. CB82]WFU42106.1 hypothetical protein QA640_06325 [Bradyrhizobium sp. CB82]
MDLRLIRQHLAEAERHLALSDRCIARQIEIIDELDRDGHATELAHELLATYRAVHAKYLVHVQTIRKELEQ